MLERAEDRLSKAPSPARTRAAPAKAAAAPAAGWRVGDQARSRSGGWTGRIAELDRAKRRATLETGAMRVSVEVADLEPAERFARAGNRQRGRPRAGRMSPSSGSSRAQSVPMSLDLRGARVEEALAALERYLEDASLAGLAKVTVIHGLGTGALRDAVRTDPRPIRCVRTVRPGERGEGGDGVTVVEL